MPASNIFRAVKRWFFRTALPPEATSRYRVAKEFLRITVVMRQEVRNTILILTGVVSAGFGLESFLIPNGFIDGGITGVSLLVNRFTNLPLPLILIVLNIPFMVLGISQINLNFAIKAMLGVTLLAVCVAVVQFPIVTTDKLLIAAFGGFFLGLGIGLAVRGGGVLDGTEVLAIYIGRKTGLSVGDFILLINIFIFGTAALLLSIETALYSILIYLAASKTIDFVLEGIEEYTGVTIISSHSEEIRTMIIEKLGRGVTMYHGKGGYGKRGSQTKEMEILFTVITRLEVAKLYTEVGAIDPDAFIVMGSIKDTKGGMVKKRAHRH
jgi:uncharacterized membrane-anchored protein YitT (DUF2179 family)